MQSFLKGNCYFYVLLYRKNALKPRIYAGFAVVQQPQIQRVYSRDQYSKNVLKIRGDIVGTYVFRRIVGIIPIIIIILVMVFLLLHLAPGNPVYILLPGEATQEDINAMMVRFGLDQPLHTQFLHFMASAVHLDFGTSFVYSQPVVELIVEKIPATLELAFAAMLIAIAIGIPLGIIASLKPGSTLDRLASSFGLFGVSVPNFWLGLILIIYLSGVLGWFPTGGRIPYNAIDLNGPTGFIIFDTLWHGGFSGFKVALSHLTLPAITLGTGMSGMIMRITRSSMLEVKNQDFIRTAHSKGLKEGKVTYSHIFRNALIPIVTIIGLELGNVLGGAIAVETVFGWPGIGTLLIKSVGMRDYFLVQGIVFFVALISIVINLLVDISYKYIDPRIHY